MHRLIEVLPIIIQKRCHVFFLVFVCRRHRFESIATLKEEEENIKKNILRAYFALLSFTIGINMRKEKASDTSKRQAEIRLMFTHQ